MHRLRPSPRLPLLAVLSSVVLGGCTAAGGSAGRSSDTAPGLPRPGTTEKVLVAHRGASAYAPEHTLPAYRLAMEQGADFIEPDLQITRDGILVALHDETLDRTTDVEDVFPGRHRVVEEDGARTRRWFAVDFSLEELRTLDAGSWFAEDFRGARIPTLEEVIALARGRVGIIPETKSPEAYDAEGFDMGRLLLEELARHGLDRPGGVEGTPVIIQSFSAASLRHLRTLGTPLTLVLLVGAPDQEGWWSEPGAARAAEFADGIGPAKRLVSQTPEVVRVAHDAGLIVVPWTFRSSAPGSFSSGRVEQEHFLHDLGVDGLFTNNPDDFPR